MKNMFNSILESTLSEGKLSLDDAIKKGWPDASKEDKASIKKVLNYMMGKGESPVKKGLKEGQILGKSSAIQYDYVRETGLLYVSDVYGEDRGGVELTIEDCVDLLKVAKKLKIASRDSFG